jgi:diguanylate cyclase (GGDEF)-like protein/PAS domain S-box-containing protein
VGLQSEGSGAAGAQAEGADVGGFENRCRSRGGTYRWFSWNACRTADGHIYAVAHDVTELKVRELKLPLSETFFRNLVESSEDAIVTKNEDGIITSWNDAAARMYGYPREEAVGRPISIIVPADRSGEEFDILRAVLNGDPVEHYETERISKDGRRLNVSLSVSPIRDKYGDVVGAAAITRDVTERKRMERQLRYLAHHDPLTGIFNRGRFQEELDQWLRYARRYGRSGALLLVDLDGFKRVNDTCGHAAGDALLRRVARVLTKHVREADVVGRMGGDEFAVLLTEIDERAAMMVAQKLLRHIRCQWSGTLISASIGVAPFGRASSLTAADLMGAADAALYEAKGAGRDQVARGIESEPALQALSS